MDAQQNELLSKLFEANDKKLMRCAYMKLHDYHRAEEIVMDVFLSAILRREEVTASPNPDAWLMRALQFKLLHELRNRASYPESVPLEQANFLGAEDEHSDIEILFSELSPKEARLAKIVWLDGYTSDEAAAILHIKPIACRKRLERIRKKLKIFWDKREI